MGKFMRVRLSEPALAEDFATFLHRCNCEVQRVAPSIVDIRVPHARRVDAGRRLARLGRCIDCGAEVAAVLAELGSVRCHDCRDEPRRSRLAGARLARLELEGYLNVWRALHPGTATTLDAGPA